jgi:hypothetical protein
MTYENIDGDKYISIVMRKLLNFSDKCPVAIGIITESINGESGVSITHKNSGKKYFFPWGDYSLDPKDFVHQIKAQLVENHYPRIVETLYEDAEVTSAELAKMLEAGTPLDKLPKTIKKVTGTVMWRIDKVIMWRDIFILVNESTGKQFRYKLNTNSVLFLKDYRSGAWVTLEEAGKYFFENAILLNEITV